MNRLPQHLPATQLCWIVSILLTITGLHASAQSYNCGPTDTPPPNNNDNPLQGPENGQGAWPTAADPVFLSSGAFYHRETDLTIPGLIPIVFARSYHNQSDFDGPIGHNWDHSFNKRLEVHTNGDVTLYEPADESVTTKLTYVKSGTAYITPAGSFRTLTQTGSYYYQRDKHGNEWEFDSTGLLVLITDRNGNQIGFEYDTADRLITVYDDFGRFVDLTYDIDGRITSIMDGNGRQVSYTYNGSDLTHVTKPGNRITQYNYDTNHNLVSILDAESRLWLQNWYDGSNRVSQQTYNGATAHFAYDTVNHITTYTDWRGYTTDYHFDPVTGNQTQVTAHTAGLRPGDPTSYTVTYTYNNDLQRTRVTMPDGSWTKFSYDANGNLVEIRRKKIAAPDTPQAHDLVTTLTYDPTYNFPTTVTDPIGHTTTTTYDASGNVVSATAPIAGSATYIYDSRGRITQWTDQVGVVYTHDYDPASGYLQRTTSDYGTGKLNAITEFAHNAIGQVTSITDPNGNTTTLSYNAYELPSVVTRSSALHIETRMYYDANSNLTQLSNKKDSSGTNWESIAFTYDQRNNVTQAVKDIATSQYLYDASGNLSQTTDPEGKVTQMIYDERGLLWKTIDAESRVTEYAYTLNGKLATLLDANGNETSYTYDDFGRPIRTTYPDMSYEELSYDKNGNITTRRTRKGDLITYTYDALDRLITKTCPDTGNTTYTYDHVSRMTSAANAHGPLNFAYDNLGRLTQFTDTYAKTLQYAYDLNGNRTQLTYPDASYVTSEFDTVNRLTAIKDPSTANIAAFSYSPLSQLTQQVNANGTYTNYAYDSLEFLQSIDHQLSATNRDYTYSRDKLGNVLTKTAPGSAAHTYTYDDVYQISQVIYPGNDIFDYTFDALGNRQTVENNGIVANYTANAMNQYTLADGAVPTYDSNGNTTFDGAQTYEYDSENRLTRATTANHIVEYSYDALDRRIEKRVYNISYVLQETIRYLHDGDNVICEYDQAGNELVRYVLAGLDHPIRRTNTGTDHYYYHADALGSITELSDDTGTFVEAYEYDIYGHVLFVDASGLQLVDTFGAPISESTVGNEYFFTGRRYESETELYYFRARFYDTKLGRFLQSDPIGYAGGLNLYAYCENDPVNYTDPYGLFGWRDAAGFVPVLGSALDAADAFRGGNIGMGILHSALAISDVVGGGYLAKTIIKGAKLAARARRGNRLRKAISGNAHKGPAQEFSHSIPNRFFREFTKSGKPNPDYKSFLDNRFGQAIKDTIFNGNNVSSKRHYLHDPYRKLRGGAALNGPRLPNVLQFLDRIPRVPAAIGALGGSSLASGLNNDCK